MKTRIATLLVMLSIFLAGSAFAAKPVMASREVSKSVANIIKEEMKYPSFAIDQKLECCVLVELLIQNDGTINVEKSNSMSPELQQYVVKTIKKLQKDNLADYAGQTVLIKVQFKLI